jgi:hypothetical protein
VLQAKSGVAGQVGVAPAASPSAPGIKLAAPVARLWFRGWDGSLAANCPFDGVPRSEHARPRDASFTGTGRAVVYLSGDVELFPSSPTS